MNILLRCITFLVFVCSIAGCDATMHSQNCSKGCSNECPDNPCALYCPKPKECAPTVKQMTFIERSDIGIGSYNPKYELQQSGIQIIELGENAIIILPTDMFFEFNSPTLREDVYLTLDHLAAFLKCYHCVPLYISVHTDNVASKYFNRVISDKRAQSIQTYLWVRGIPFRRLPATGCGNAAPIANQLTFAGNAANRRIEIRVRRAS